MYCPPAPRWHASRGVLASRAGAVTASNFVFKPFFRINFAKVIYLAVELPVTDRSQRQAALGRLQYTLPGEERVLQVPGSPGSVPRSPLGHCRDILGVNCCTQAGSISARQEGVEDARNEPGFASGRGDRGLGPSIWRAAAWGLLGPYPYQNSTRKRDLDGKDYCISSAFIIKSGEA